ncbi:hypothetical protein TMEN_2804 [Trichophyton mentagrophytes]|nr:hypothetical protein H101_08146 [Trichophyton interdigitale H6]GBF60376.1 hypothetical protein TMEN_2804 [Trichophyton mentagrophytes]
MAQHGTPMRERARARVIDYRAFEGRTMRAMTRGTEDEPQILDEWGPNVPSGLASSFENEAMSCKKMTTLKESPELRQRDALRVSLFPGPPGAGMTARARRGREKRKRE